MLMLLPGGIILIEVSQQAAHSSVTSGTILKAVIMNSRMEDLVGISIKHPLAVTMMGIVTESFACLRITYKTTVF